MSRLSEVLGNSDWMALVPYREEKKVLLSKEYRNLLPKWDNVIFEQKSLYALFLR